MTCNWYSMLCLIVIFAYCNCIFICPTRIDIRLTILIIEIEIIMYDELSWPFNWQINTLCIIYREYRVMFQFSLNICKYIRKKIRMIALSQPFNNIAYA